MKIKVIIDTELSVYNGCAIGKLHVGLPMAGDNEGLLEELRNRNYSVAWEPLKEGWGEYESYDYRWGSYELTEDDAIRTPDKLRDWVRKKLQYVRDTIATVLAEQHKLQEYCEELSGNRFEFVFNPDGTILSENNLE